MRLTYTVAVVALLGCGGGDFRSEAPGPDGGPGVGSGGSGGCEGCAGSTASSAEASSTGEGPGGGGGCGACGGDGGAQSSASVGGNGGETASSSTGGGGAPCVPKTCETENVYCATIADGCGNLIVCPGTYKLDPICTYPSMYGCECPWQNGKSWYCDLPNGVDDPGNTPPPPGKGTCVDNPQQPQFANFWCCEGA